MKETIEKALSEMGYTLLPMQEKMVDAMSAGEDILLQDETGSGKTLAYLCPALDQIDEENGDPQVLIIAPTRELVVQIALDARKLAAYTKIHVIPVYGGMDPTIQINALKYRKQLIIATAGRLLDLLRQGILQLNGVGTVILDEADLLETTGQSEEVDQILSFTSSPRIVCVSATGSASDHFLKGFYLTVGEKTSTVKSSIHTWRFISENKEEDIVYLLTHLSIKTAILFVNERQTALDLADTLQDHDILAHAFSGYFSESKRLSIMEQFAKGQIRVLVATDAAARGLDIPEVSHIVHYDLPVDTETYIHRSGRAARQKDPGISIAVLTNQELQTPAGMYIRLHTEEIPAIGNTVYDLSVPYKKKEKPSPSVTTLFIRAGRKDKIRPGDIAGAFGALLDSSLVGPIEIQDHYSLVTLYTDDPEITSLSEIFIKGKKRKVELKTSPR